MPKAKVTSTTSRRRAEDAATIGLMLLKAALSGLPGGEPSVAVSQPKRPVLAGGAAARVLEDA